MAQGRNKGCIDDSFLLASFELDSKIDQLIIFLQANTGKSPSQEHFLKENELIFLEDVYIEHYTFLSVSFIILDLLNTDIAMELSSNVMVQGDE